MFLYVNFYIILVYLFKFDLKFLIHVCLSNFQLIKNLVVQNIIRKIFIFKILRDVGKSNIPIGHFYFVKYLWTLSLYSITLKVIIKLNEIFKVFKCRMVHVHQSWVSYIEKVIYYSYSIFYKKYSLRILTLH